MAHRISNRAGGNLSNQFACFFAHSFVCVFLFSFVLFFPIPCTCEQENSDEEMQRWLWLRTKVQVASTSCLRSGQRLQGYIYGLVSLSFMLCLQVRSPTKIPTDKLSELNTLTLHRMPRWGSISLQVRCTSSFRRSSPVFHSFHFIF